MRLCLIKLADFRHQITPRSQNLISFKAKGTPQTVVKESLTSAKQRESCLHISSGIWTLYKK